VAPVEVGVARSNRWLALGNSLRSGHPGSLEVARDRFLLRFQERAEKHRAAAEKWAAIRREIHEMLALHPGYLAERSDPKAYLDDLRQRLDEASGQAPEIGERDWTSAQRKLGLLEAEPSKAVPASHEATAL
jgi:hypothetical protein